MPHSILANPIKSSCLIVVSLFFTPPSIFGMGYYCGRTRPIKRFMNTTKDKQEDEDKENKE